jgi:hypothetical protein
MLRNLALESLRVPGKLKDLADYQVAKLSEELERLEAALALAVQQCYRHIFFPSRNRLDGANCDLATPWSTFRPPRTGRATARSRSSPNCRTSTSCACPPTTGLAGLRA